MRVKESVLFLIFWLNLTPIYLLAGEFAEAREDLAALEMDYVEVEETGAEPEDYDDQSNY